MEQKKPIWNLEVFLLLHHLQEATPSVPGEDSTLFLDKNMMMYPRILLCHVQATPCKRLCSLVLQRGSRFESCRVHIVIPLYFYLCLLLYSLICYFVWQSSGRVFHNLAALGAMTRPVSHNIHQGFTHRPHK